MKVVSEIKVGNYSVLKLDGSKPNHKYTKYIIDGQQYDIVPMYDADNCIAVRSSESLNGKTVSFE